MVATNSAGSSAASAAVNATAGDGLPPAISPASQTINGTVGIAITATTAFTATNFAGDVVYSLDSDLPSGLSLDTDTGVISGTPTEIQSATTYTVIGADQSGNSDTATVSITVAAPPAALSPASQTVNGTVGIAITATTAFTATNFTGGVIYSIDSDLPSGLSLDTDTGVISGTPTVVQSAATYTVTGADQSGNSATATVSITVAAAPTAPGAPTITQTDSGDGEIYLSVTISDDGGSAVTGYTASCTDGTTTFTGTGADSPITVSGLTNDTAYTCTVTATNDVGTSTASAAVTGTPRVPPGAPSITGITTGDGSLEVAFSAGSGGAADDYTLSCVDQTGGRLSGRSRETPAQFSPHYIDDKPVLSGSKTFPTAMAFHQSQEFRDGSHRCATHDQTMFFAESTGIWG